MELINADITFAERGRMCGFAVVGHWKVNRYK